MISPPFRDYNAQLLTDSASPFPRRVKAARGGRARGGAGARMMWRAAEITPALGVTRRESWWGWGNKAAGFTLGLLLLICAVLVTMAEA